MDTPSNKPQHCPILMQIALELQALSCRSLSCCSSGLDQTTFHAVTTHATGLVEARLKIGIHLCWSHISCSSRPLNLFLGRFLLFSFLTLSFRNAPLCPPPPHCFVYVSTAVSVSDSMVFMSSDVDLTSSFIGVSFPLRLRHLTQTSATPPYSKEHLPRSTSEMAEAPRDQRGLWKCLFFGDLTNTRY